ncbi:Uncharacterized protein Fot_25196 [Forsythia ovata]|uniref:Uncharacterized protein n=1 Tax=Forsythia ovata TaxID=205694 RepID=A0ABD1U931_9LAMI
MKLEVNQIGLTGEDGLVRDRVQYFSVGTGQHCGLLGNSSSLLSNKGINPCRIVGANLGLNFIHGDLRNQPPEPQQAEFQFMPTPGIISQHISGPHAALPWNHLQPNLSLDSMVDDLQLMENEEQARMKIKRSKNRIRSFQAPRKLKPN